MKKVITLLYCIGLFTGLSFVTQLNAQTTFPSGSFIVNMGVTPQTIGNGLKPYGLIYDLVKNYNVPIYWYINQAKAKDGVDFTYNGIQYKGGTFLVSQSYITPTVASRITYWQSQGVVGVYTSSAFTITPTYRITWAPIWTLDAQNGSIATGFFTNAGIPSTAYNWQSPSLLSACNDIFVMPHADPTWATHSNLLTWNQTYKGAIWAGCHAVSALEGMYNPADKSQQTNFLSVKTGNYGGTASYADNALVLWGVHTGGSIPYTTTSPTEYTFPVNYNPKLVAPNDPVAQYMGVSDLAHLNGSEQIYLPVLAGGWRSTTKVITYDPTQANTVPVGTLSNGPAVIIAYGRGFGDPSRGQVMYEAGHSINKGTAGDVAAQRAFFNWSYLSHVDKSPVMYGVTGIPAGGVFPSQPYPQNYPLSVSASSPIGAAIVSVLWSCKRSDTGADFGTFTPNGTQAAASTVFTPNSTNEDVQCVITVKVTDACGRSNFDSYPVVISKGPQPPVAVNDQATITGSCVQPGTCVDIYPLSNDYDINGDPIALTAISGGTNGIWTLSGSKVTYCPTANFFGSATSSYTVCDNTGLCSTGTITVGVGTPDGNGCYPGTTWGIETTLSASGQINSGVDNPTYALGDPNYDPADPLTYAGLKDAGDILTLDFGAVYTPPAYEYVTFYFASNNEGTTASANVSYSTDNITYSSPVLYSTTSNDPGGTFSIAIPVSGIRYLKIARSAGTIWFDAAQLENYSCVSAAVQANADAVDSYEDIPTTINVIGNDVNPGNLVLSLTITTPPANGKVSINPDNTITYINNTDYPSGTANAADAFTYRICNSQGLCSSANVNITIINDGCADGQYKPLGTDNPVEVTFQASATTDNSVEDSYIKADSDGNDNYGGSTTLEIGKKTAKAKRGLFRFNNVTTIPSNAVVQSALFSIYLTGGDNNTLTYNVHQLTQTWTEAGVTWLKYDGTNNWTNAGGTYNSTAAATLTTGKVVGYKEFSIPGIVQNWVKTPANGGYANYGIIVKQANEATGIDKRHQFGSSENNTLGLRPKLVVTYVTPLPCAPLINRAPLANPDFATTPSSTAISIPVLTNDSDPDAGNTLSILSIGTVTGGTASISGSSIIFTPNSSYTGTTTFTYTVQDNSGLTDQTNVTVTVTNVPPAANWDNATVASNSSNTAVSVLTNDTDPDGPAGLTMTILTPPTNGTASLSGTSIGGTVTLTGMTILYTPASNFTGTDQLIYQLCEPVDPNACVSTSVCDTAKVVITVTNLPPVANNDTYTIVPCKAVTLNILSNDTDPEGGTLSVTITQQPASGIATVNADGSVTFTPATNSPTPVTFQYTVTDNGVPPLTSNFATVTINIENPSINNPPVAVRDDWEMVWNSHDVISVLDNDYEPDGQEITLPEISAVSPLREPSHGTYSINVNGTIEYEPFLNFNGYDTLVYRICDRINNAVTCSVTNGLCDTALVVIYVKKPNSPPDAVDDYYTFPANTTSYGNVTYNDSDPDNNLLSYYLVDGGTAAVNGTITFNLDGTFSYLPNTGFTGSVSFVYQVCDNGIPSMCDVATVYIDIVPITISGTVYNDANGLSDAAVNGIGIQKAATAQLYSYLIQGGNVVSKMAIQPGGSYSFSAQQSSTYTVVISALDVPIGAAQPSPSLPAGWAMVGDYYGMNNGAGSGTKTGTLVTTVITGTSNVTLVDFGIEQPPVAVNDSYTTLVNVAVTGNVLINDSDGEGSNLTVSLNTGPGSGTLTLNPDGTFSYSNAVAGTYTFTYNACDPAGLCSTATVTILVKECETPTSAPGIIQIQK
ncbi:MAG TPA: Ig-like domain-containing protein [Bacteroidales bacterium]|nr:Ig-like domain-containing protein [Bacteroidales bacterium]